MAKEYGGRGGGGADHRGHQATMAKEQPIDLDNITPQELNRRSEALGKELARDITTNQIRNIYGAVQHIRVRASRPHLADDINRSLIFLKPKLAYASGRQKKLISLRNVLVQAIDSVVQSKNPERARENFFILMESVVAYHRFYGGKETSGGR